MDSVENDINKMIIKMIEETQKVNDVIIKKLDCELEELQEIRKRKEKLEGVRDEP